MLQSSEVTKAYFGAASNKPFESRNSYIGEGQRRTHVSVPAVESTFVGNGLLEFQKFPETDGKGTIRELQSTFKTVYGRVTSNCSNDIDSVFHKLGAKL